jgi:CRISPR system Cascade subunit CasB
MSTPTAQEVPLVTRLIGLARQQDRGALAALRTGLGKPPGTAARMLPIVAPFLSSDEGPATQAAFITAALFGSHPVHADVGSLGDSLGRATKRHSNPDGKHGEPGVEARFAAALDADPQDLVRHLAGLVSLCESAGVPVNWHQFCRDVRGLLGENEQYQARIRTRWAREFWRGSIQRTDPKPTISEENEQ